MSAQAEIVAKQVKRYTVKDADGRVIVMRKPNLVAQYRLVEAAGDSSKNEVYMGMIMPLIYVESIGAEPVILPRNKKELELLIALVEEEGLKAISEGLKLHFSDDDPKQDVEKAKK